MSAVKRLYLLFCLGVMMIGPDAHAANARADKKNVSLWYEAFSKKDPALLDRILSKNWVDIPPAPDQPPGPAGAKQILLELTTAFPDLDIKRTVPLSGASAIGNEPHHVGISNDGRTLAVGGLLSILRGQDQVFFFDVADPRHPTFIRADNPPQSSITDEFAPLSNGGFLVTFMGC